MKRALFLPPFDELADPRVLGDLAAESEAAGWDGIFVWDHVLRPGAPRPIADPWIALAAVAMRTERLRIGPMVTPLARRRVHKLAREVSTLDHLSRGRVTLGLGLGVDTGRELSAFGEPVIDAVERGDLFDEGLPVLRAMLRGERVVHRGRFLTADDVTLRPATVQADLPVWMAVRTMHRRPLRRAATGDGIFPIELTPEQVGELLSELAVLRPGGLDGFDVVALASSGHAASAWESVGATWWFEDVQPGATAADVRSLITASVG